MRYRLPLLFLVLVLGVCWVAAQDSPSQGSAKGGSGQTMSVQGCLSGTDGNYSLTDKTGNTFQLTGATSMLNEHNGHEVKVMGTLTPSPSSGSSGGMGQASGSQQTIAVASIKHVSKTCKSGSMSH